MGSLGSINLSFNFKNFEIMKDPEVVKTDDVTMSNFSQIISITFVTLVVVFLFVKILFF